MPLFKAVATETDATNMVDATPVADATKVADEGREKRTREKRKSTKRKKADADEGKRKGKSKKKLAFSSATSEYPPAVARETDATKMADAKPVADASMDAGEGGGKGTG